MHFIGRAKATRSHRSSVVRGSEDSLVGRTDVGVGREEAKKIVYRGVEKKRVKEERC